MHYLKKTLSFITLLALALFMSCEQKSQKDNSKQLPNILFIFADDLGYGDVQCYNPKSKIPTPHLNQLAKEGLLFTDAHSPATVCTPSRYGLLTGRMPFRARKGAPVFSGVSGGGNLIEKNRLNLANMLQAKGYKTACIGKWHLGMTFHDKQGQVITKGGNAGVKLIDYSRKIPDNPTTSGFDTFFGTVCCPTTDWLYAFIDNDHIPVPPTGQIDKKKLGLPTHIYSRDCRPGMHAPDFDLEEVDMTFLKKSQQFLKDHVTQSPKRPFFLFHSTQAVHLPSFPGKNFQGKTQQGPHGDFIFQLDHIVGELMKTLEKLKVADNTIVMFSSDNGPEALTIMDMRKTHKHDGAYPWRGIKRDVWEGGHRVPFIVKWPGVIKAGRTTKQTTSLVDVMATVADIVGTTLPKNAGEDSFSMYKVFIGTQAENKPARDFLMVQGFGRGKYLALRKGDWKLMDYKGSGGNHYENNWKLKGYHIPDNDPKAAGQLYNLKSDPKEVNNVYSKYPDIVKELQDKLKQLRESGRSRP